MVILLARAGQGSEAGRASRQSQTRKEPQKRKQPRSSACCVRAGAEDRGPGHACQRREVGANNSLRSSRATRFGDFINMRGCLSSFAAAGGVVLLLVAVVEVMLGNCGKRWNLARHSQRFWQLVACDLSCFL